MGNNCAAEKIQVVELVLNAGDVLHDRIVNREDMEESILNQLLIKAAREGRHNDVSLYLQNGAFVETRRPITIAFHDTGFEEEYDADMGLTPLMHAALGGYAKACQVLLSAGASVNSRDEDGMQPLHFAANSGNLEVFTLLLQAKADPWAQDSQGRSPLDHLASDEHKHADYNARPALKALLSMIVATPAPDEEVDAEEDACDVAEEFLDLSQVNSEASSLCGDAGSYGKQDLDHGLNDSRPLRDAGSFCQDMAASPFGSGV
jgi:hypothetical protein